MHESWRSLCKLCTTINIIIIISSSSSSSITKLYATNSKFQIHNKKLCNANKKEKKRSISGEILHKIPENDWWRDGRWVCLKLVFWEKGGKKKILIKKIGLILILILRVIWGYNKLEIKFWLILQNLERERERERERESDGCQLHYWFFWHLCLQRNHS